MLPFNLSQIADQLSTSSALDSVHSASDNQTGSDVIRAPVSQVARCDWFTFVLYVLVLGAVCLFGLVGNALSFLVLRAERHSHVATFLLQTMAVADSLFLLTTGLSQMTMALSEFVESRLDDVTELEKYDVMYNFRVIIAYVQVRFLAIVSTCPRRSVSRLNRSSQTRSLR